MGKGFKTWFEGISVRDAVVGVVSGGDLVGDEEESHLLSRKTTDFSAAIRSRIRGLGIIGSLPKSTRPAVYRAIDDGATVGELIRMVSDSSIKEGRYESEMDSFSRKNELSFLVKGEPRYMKTPEGFAGYLRKKGLTEDEVAKRVHARFGASESVSGKALVVMRGVSGSGKSTAARRIAQERGGVIFSTDDYFEREGRYEFDPKMLPAYHAMNQKRTEEAMERGVSPIIVDNTNTQAWEMKPYIEAARRHGYEVEIVEPGSPGFPEADFDEIMRRQKKREGGKSMPEEVVRRMTDRFQKGLSVDDILASRSPLRP